MIFSLRNRVLKISITLFAVLCILVILPYIRYTAYTPQPIHPFEGAYWYNPYVNVRDTLLRANFHAHSRSWWGLTWGANSAKEIIDAYAAQGYQIPALSNYHNIADSSLYQKPLIFIPTYEHGLNWRKVHCLCIGAHDISFLEYPLHFSLHHSNDVIRSLHQHCALVALAHPGARNAHEPEDMPALSALQLMEVANTQGVLTSYWDAMLSAGRAVWFLADDDTHDLNDGEAFMRWNLIYASEPTAEAAIASLRHGNHIGVASYDGECEHNQLTEFALHGDTLQIALKDTFNRLDFIGQNGVHLHSVGRNDKASYILLDTDTYVRTEVHHDHCVMYLNPVIRFDGKHPPQELLSLQSRNHMKTWIGRSVVLLILAGVVFSWIRLLRRL